MGCGASRADSTVQALQTVKQHDVVHTDSPQKIPLASHAAPTAIPHETPKHPHVTPETADEPSAVALVRHERRITICHFNDIYCIEPSTREPVGGAARLAHTVKSMSSDKPLVVFSGDAFNPSLLSTITLGAQMPPVLNEIGVHVACIGNHDFDFGTAQLMKLIKQCNFPWLMANVLDKETRKPYANAKSTLLLDWHGVKVGFVGLVEEEWLETLGAVNPNDLEYVDFVEEGHRLAKDLQEQGAELLVAITHMRVPNDQRLCRECPEFHLVMGGHDHHYHVEQLDPVLLVKSGTDFRDLTRVDVVLPADGGRPSVTWKRLTMESKVPEDPPVAQLVESFMGKMTERMSEVIGHTLTDLDGRFTTVRMRESNLGNLLCDILKTATAADVVLINGGTFRSDAIHAAGPFTLGDMVSILPMMDSTIVIEATGSQILQGLENGVCMYPKLEGRFPQVAGVCFMFDPAGPPKQRIVPGSVLIGGEPLQPDKKYRMCTKPYVAEGKDGYDVFKQCRVLVSEEGGVLLPTAVRNHFRYLEILNLWDPKPRVMKFARKWSSAVLRKRGSSHSLQDAASKPDVLSEDNFMEEEMKAIIDDVDPLGSMDILPSRSNVNASDHVCVLGDQLSNFKYAIKPEVDGRIMMLQV